MKKIPEQPNKTNTITINEDTDFRFVTPLPPKPLIFDDIINDESNRKLVEEAKIDDRCPNYRDPLVDSMVKDYIHYLNEYQISAIKQIEHIAIGASNQLKRVTNEIKLLEKIDELLSN